MNTDWARARVTWWLVAARERQHAIHPTYPDSFVCGVALDDGAQMVDPGQDAGDAARRMVEVSFPALDPSEAIASSDAPRCARCTQRVARLVNTIRRHDSDTLVL